MTNEKTNSGPFITVTTLRIKEGKREELMKFSTALVKIFEEKEPQLITFNVFFNEDGSEMTSIQVHPNSASMDFHLQVLGPARQELRKQYGDMFDFTEMKSFDYYGTPSAALLESLQPLLGSGVTLSAKPVHITGFTRPPAD